MPSTFESQASNSFQGPQFQTSEFEGPEFGEEEASRIFAGSKYPSERNSSSKNSVQFDWPVNEATMTRGYNSKGRGHWGLDLAHRRGSPILSAENGVVIYTGSGFRGYGKLIVVEHGNDWATLYSHLSKILVREGQTVDRGQKIGLMGRTGHATGVHLHFEIRHYRKPVDPLAHLPKVNGSIADTKH